MMTFFALLAAGMGLITAIARYNESDNLFWKFTVSFLGAIIAAKVAVTVIENKEQNKAVVTSAVPTQAHESVSCIPCTLAGTSLVATRREKSPKPVSKGFYTSTNDSILSKVLVSARGQPQVESVLPILCGPDYFDTS